MMNVQLFRQIRFKDAAPAALKSIAFSGLVRLSFPVWAIVGIKSPTPGRIIFSPHSDVMSLIKASFAAILVLAPFNLIRLSSELFAASNTSYLNLITRDSTDIIGSHPNSRAFPATKIVIFYGAWGNPFFFAALDTLDNRLGELTFSIAKYLFALTSVGGALNWFTAPRTIERGAALLRFAGALPGAINLTSCFKRSKKKHFAAFLASKLNTILNRFRQLLSGKFATTTIRAGESPPVLQFACLDRVLLATNGAGFFCNHKGIISQYVYYATVGSEMIGAVLAGWDEVTGIEQSAHYCDIAHARLAWWSQWPGWGQTDVDKILQAATQKEAGQISLFDLLEAA